MLCDLRWTWFCGWHCQHLQVTALRVAALRVRSGRAESVTRLEAEARSLRGAGPTQPPGEWGEGSTRSMASSRDARQGPALACELSRDLHRPGAPPPTHLLDPGNRPRAGSPTLRRSRPGGASCWSGGQPGWGGAGRGESHDPSRWFDCGATETLLNAGSRACPSCTTTTTNSHAHAHTYTHTHTHNAPAHIPALRHPPRLYEQHMAKPHPRPAQSNHRSALRVVQEKKYVGS